MTRRPNNVHPDERAAARPHTEVRHPDVVADLTAVDDPATDEKHWTRRALPATRDFLLDVAEAFRRGGWVTGGQAQAVRAARERTERMVHEREERVRTAKPIPTGENVEIEGEIVKRYVKETTYGPRPVMVVEVDGGWRVWGTVSRSIDPDVGDRVRFTAEVSVSEEDPCFGFFKYPKNATSVARRSQNIAPS